MLKIRLSRWGAKNRPYYHVVVADSHQPRDGRFLEQVGTYDPKLPKDHADRVRLNADRIKHWLSVGAQPSDRVAIFLGKAGITDMPERKNNPQKAKQKAKMAERAKERAEKAAAAAEAANAPAEEAAPAEETAAPEAEAPAEAAAEG